MIAKPDPTHPVILRAQNLSVSYGGLVVLEGVNLDVYRHQILGLIGRSGCGKSTLLRCFNRLNDLVKNSQVSGKITLDGQDIYSPQCHPVELRRRVGMVFQRPNPFPKSIYNNIAVSLRINGYRGNLDEAVENALKQVGLWDEVKNNLRRHALTLSGGQQQRLCIARAIALQPEVILMDEPCSALDPISTLQVENLLHSLKESYTIVIVTHNLKQAARVSDYVAYFDIKTGETAQRVGYLVECERTEIIFQKPHQQSTRNYVSGGSLPTYI
ncbi:MAG: phosphate ABC transporter ATP-binding protein [Chloroflexaceae bacterium]|nr:phosphate ABC transporter ATP-binding protein [Chloroflexaceae bacterium]